MNKLTEIKRKIKEVKGLKGALKKAESDGYSYVGLLGYKVKLSTKEHELSELLIESDIISLLEEKDKALSFYANIENYEDQPDENSEPFNPEWLLAKVIADQGNIARKALNTSSNSEGE